jgi:hypothetical protein
VQWQIAVDPSTGNPVAASFAGAVWVRIDAAILNDGGGITPVGGVTTLAVDLDNLASLNISVGVGITLQNVICDQSSPKSIGFRAHFIGQGGGADENFSPSADLTINPCTADCSNLNTIQVGIEKVFGDGTPIPGESAQWKFRVTAQNCTGVDLTGVKVQGGSNGWTTLDSAVSDKSPQPVVKSNNKNEVITWTGALANNEKLKIDVMEHGTIKSTDACSSDPDNPSPGTVRFLSGAWSAAWTQSGLQRKSDYTGRVSIVVTCP